MSGHIASEQQAAVAPSYDYLIVFRQHTDAPEKWKEQWGALMRTIATNPSSIVAEWLERLKSSGEDDDNDDTPPRVADLVPLDRCEGGIGGDDNKTCRQIRFCEDTHMQVVYGAPAISWRDYNEIKLIAMRSWDDTDVWTPAELCVYRDTFNRVIVNILGREAHEGRVEIRC